MEALEDQILGAIKAISRLDSRRKEAAVFRFPTGFESVTLRGRHGTPLRNRFWNLLDLLGQYSCALRLEVVCGGQAYAFATTEEYDSWRNSRENRRVVAESVNILVTSQ